MSKNQAVSTPEIDNLTFEQALAELESIVRDLENGQGDLEHSIGDYERGTRLKEHCMKKLASARLKVEKILQNQQGEVKTEPFDGEGGKG